MLNIDAANPANCYTVSLGKNGATTSFFLPLHQRGNSPDGSPEIARVKVGTMYLGVGVYNNPAIGNPDVLSGAWLPIKIERKEPKPGAPGSQVLLVPYNTVYGQKRPVRYKQLILIQGVKGAIVAPHSSECSEVLRSGNEVLILVNSGCSFQVTRVDGTTASIYIDSSGTHVLNATSMGGADWSEYEITQGTFAAPVPTPPPPPPDNGVWFELWKMLSYPEGWDKGDSEDKEWLELLFTTLKAMYPRWSPRISHVYPELPHKGVCRPLTASTYQSPSFSSQWAIDSQYFAGFYDALRINEDLAAGSMPPSRLLMRCLYEIYWLSKAPGHEHPQAGSVLLTIPSLLDG
jgi:hypothetical protein